MVFEAAAPLPNARKQLGWSARRTLQRAGRGLGQPQEPCAGVKCFTEALQRHRHVQSALSVVSAVADANGGNRP
jgi:hypothetical protein